jgi:flagellar assembly protein FliH
MSSSKESRLEVEQYQYPGLGELDGPPTTEFVFKPLKYREPATPQELEEARGILGEARQKAQHIEREAYEQGFIQGQKDGREVGERSLEQLVLQFQGLVGAMVREKEEVYRQRERELVDLVLLISRKIVVRELSLRPETIRDIVAEGFKVLADSENIKIRLHPQDHEILQRSSREGWPPLVELIADGTVSPGGFLMETATGEIDGTFQNRWAMVARVVQDLVKVADGAAEF